MIKKIIRMSVVVGVCSFFYATANTSKIVGLMMVRNESAIIEQTLRALAVYTDALVILDDASCDNTVDIFTIITRGTFY